MNRLSISRTRGFTVIELMIVVIIIAILVALAYPSYINYVRKAKRGEAQQLLLNWAINQEIWRSNNPAYNSEDNPASPGYIIPDHDLYDFDWPAAPDATTYVLRATPTGDQANDKARNGEPCDFLTLNQNGVKEPAACWE